MKVAVLFANGMEELEALTPVDVLRRAGADICTISINGKTVIGSHNIPVIADCLLNETDLSDYDAIVLPGGLPGATNLSKNATVVSETKKALLEGRLVSAICASPAVVLAKHGLIDGRKATCYPSPEFVKMLGSSYTNENVTTDNNLITANGPKSALDFSLAICKYLSLTPKF